MAVVNVKSSTITNADASPMVKNSPLLERAMVRECVGQAAAANGDSIGSTYRLARLPSHARVSQVLLSCTAITTCAGDVGIYRTADDGGAVVDADLFASAASLATALVNSDVTRESGVITVANMEKTLWELAGLSADPKVMYDVVITLTAAAGSAGTVGLIVRYADNT